MPWHTSSSHTFNNLGTFTRAGAGDTVISGITFSNSGTVLVQDGAFRLDGGFTNFSGTTLTGGTYLIRGAFRFTNANIVTNAADLTLDGLAATVINHVNAYALANFATNAPPAASRCSVARRSSAQAISPTPARSQSLATAASPSAELTRRPAGGRH